MKKVEKGETSVTVRAPKFQVAVFDIKGIAPLCTHRFSLKVKGELKDKMESGKPASSKRKREARSTDDLYNEARYFSKNGKEQWDGFPASAVRNAMIEACRLVGFKMTLAKLSIFTIEDGYDVLEPYIPLVRIYGKPVKSEMVGRTATGQPYITVRPMYHNWSARLKLRWDADQFTLQDISNLLMRVGLQVGFCEGRPFSKNSAGMGWGLFEISNGKEGKKK